jgi:hypothetical protein
MGLKDWVGGVIVVTSLWATLEVLRKVFACVGNGAHTPWQYFAFMLSWLATTLGKLLDPFDL